MLLCLKSKVYKLESRFSVICVYSFLHIILLELYEELLWYAHRDCYTLRFSHSSDVFICDNLLGILNRAFYSIAKGKLFAFHFLYLDILYQIILTRFTHLSISSTKQTSDTIQYLNTVRSSRNSQKNI